MKKRVISILMVGALAMGLVTGCGSGENTQDSQGSSKGSSGKKVTLSVLAGQSTTDAGIEEFIDAALEKRELIKVAVLKNCIDDPREIASVIGERTHSAVVKVIGKKMIFYRPAKKNPKIKLPE